MHKKCGRCLCNERVAVKDTGLGYHELPMQSERVDVHQPTLNITSNDTGIVSMYQRMRIDNQKSNETLVVLLENTLKDLEECLKKQKSKMNVWKQTEKRVGNVGCHFTVCSTPNWWRGFSQLLCVVQLQVNS